MDKVSHYCRDFYQWISRFWSYPATSKVTRSAPNSRINKLDTPFDAPSSGSSSALRINIVRQTHERMKHFLWKTKLKSSTNCNGTHGTQVGASEPSQTARFSTCHQSVPDAFVRNFIKIGKAKILKCFQIFILYSCYFWIADQRAGKSWMDERR